MIVVKKKKKKKKKKNFIDTVKNIYNQMCKADGSVKRLGPDQNHPPLKQHRCYGAERLK